MKFLIQRLKFNKIQEIIKLFSEFDVLKSYKIHQGLFCFLNLFQFDDGSLQIKIHIKSDSSYRHS